MVKIFIAHKENGKEQTVKEHLFETAELSSQFAKKIGLTKMGYLSGLLHDLGKYSDEFYNRIVNNGEKCDHSTAGAQMIAKLFNEIDLKNKNAICEILELIILSHHSGLIDEVDFNGSTPRINRLTKEIHLNDILKNADKEILEKANDFVGIDLFNEFNSVLQIIANNSEKSKSVFQFYLTLLTKFMFSCLVDADRKNTIYYKKLVNELKIDK